MPVKKNTKTRTHSTKSASRTADSKVTKASAKKQKQKSRAIKVQIEKLNSDLTSISTIQKELTKNPQKEIHTLDPESLRDGLEKDKKTRSESKQAEQDLQSQLEMITGFSL